MRNDSTFEWCHFSLHYFQNISLLDTCLNVLLFEKWLIHMWYVIWPLWKLWQTHGLIGLPPRHYFPLWYKYGNCDVWNIGMVSFDTELETLWEKGQLLLMTNLSFSSQWFCLQSSATAVSKIVFQVERCTKVYYIYIQNVFAMTHTTDIVNMSNGDLFKQADLLKNIFSVYISVTFNPFSHVKTWKTFLTLSAPNCLK